MKGVKGGAREGAKGVKGQGPEGGAKGVKGQGPQPPCQAQPM